MKYTFSALLLFFIACINKPVEYTVSIPDYRNTKEPQNDPTSHKDKDVEIFKRIFMGETYSTIIYRNDHGVLRGYQADVQADKNYDKATYAWTNDSTVTVRLFVSSTDSSKRFSISGNGNSTSLEGGN